VRVRDLASAERRELGASSWLTITQQRIDDFAFATDDHQWIHVDPARAAAGPFGTTIAHGYLLLSLVPGMIEEVLQLEDRSTGVNYGVDRLRFTGAVARDTHIRGRTAVVRGERRSDGGVLLTLEVVVERQDEAAPALVAELLTIVYD